MFPVHIEIGSLFMPFYEGAYFAISLLIGLLLATRILEKNGKKESEFGSIFTFALIGAIIGGRLFHILFWNLEFYLVNPIHIFTFWEGGISITGGLFGGILLAYIICRIKKVDFFSYLSMLAPIMLLCQAIGRIGCFLNGDAYGIPTYSNWGIALERFGTNLFSFTKNLKYSSAAWQDSFSAGLVAFDSSKTALLHPTQLYEAAFDIGILLVLLILKKMKKADTVICYTYFALYSLFRFFVEYVRADRNQIVLWNTSAIQYFLLIVFLISSIQIFLLHKGKNQIKEDV